MIYIIIIILGFALAALAVVGWLLYRREYHRRRDEISRAASIEKEKDAEIETLKEWLSSFEKRGDFWFETAEKMTLERDSLQDYKSSILCPTNNHIWVDGVCTKCGRIQE